MALVGAARDPERITRILFQAFPGWAVALFYLCAGIAILIFLYGCYRHLRKYRRGGPPPIGGIDAGIAAMLALLLSHRTLKRRDPAAGYGHALIFFGFALLFVGTCTIALQYDILAPLAGIRFWYGAFYLWFSLVLDLAGLGLVVGLLYMMYRRAWLAPPKLDYVRPDRSPGDPDFDRSHYRRGDWVFLWSLLLIGITGFLLEAARLVWLRDQPAVWDYRWWSPVGAVLAYAMQGAGLSAASGGVLRTGLWWFHGLLALSFIASIPFTKARHLFTAMVSLAVHDPRSASHLHRADLAAEHIGATHITDLNWKQLLHLDACTLCGRCHEACPATATGLPLSPRDLVLSLRDLADAGLGKATLPERHELAAVGEGVNQVRAETLWCCRTCAACMEICPVGIEHVGLIVDMRRALVEAGNMGPTLQAALQNIQSHGNSFGEGRRKRPAWARTLGFEIKDARREPVDVLWFVGDFAAFDPRSQRVSRAFARILRHAGVDFGILYEAEVNAGNDVRRVGEEGLYDHLAASNIATLSACDFKRIVTTDPHSYNTIRNEYPDFGGRFEIEHASALIGRLLAGGRIKLKKKLDLRLTYHDPCHLGRLNKGYAPPRESVLRLGAELVEMQRSRDNSFCCGAGGGRIWMPDPAGSERPAENRMREAAQIAGLDVFVVSCPKCMSMFEDAVKSTGNEERFKVRELIELVEECVDFAGASGPGATNFADGQ